MNVTKISYNGVNKETWLENGQYKERKSTFLDVGSLEKSGRDIHEDLRKNGMEEAPRKFVEIKEF